MIEAYCLKRSYQPGDPIDLCVSTTASSYSLTVTRMGVAPQKLLQLDGLKGELHLIPPDAVEKGCRWPPAQPFAADEQWVSGFYKLDLLSSDAEHTEAFFVLRPLVASASILWVIETNTWNAYNFFGGASTYTVDGEAYAAGAPRVSFERPLPKGFLSLPADRLRFATVGAPDPTVPYGPWAEQNGVSFWTGAASWGHWDTAFAEWIEREGLTVDYATNEDLHNEPDLLAPYRMFLSVGHDEYWSWEMRDAVETFVASGGNAAFFSGNTSFWQIRIEDEGRQMVAFKADVAKDPVMGTADERRNTGMWSNASTARPENGMTGVSFARAGYSRFAKSAQAASGGYTIYRPDHWALEGTELRFGDLLGATDTLVGYETDGCVFQFDRGRPCPTGEDGTPANFEIIGIAPAALFSHESGPEGLYPPEALSDLQMVAMQIAGSIDDDAVDRFTCGHATMGSFTVPNGGSVFTGGTTEWAYCLQDEQVARITRNVFARFSEQSAVAG